MKCLVSQAMLAVAAFAFGADWTADLWLDRGGFWTNRAAVVATNLSGRAIEGFGVEAPLPSGADGDDLRVVDGSGTQLQFSRRNGNVVFPVTVAAHGESRYIIYWGNPAALAPAYNSWRIGRDAAATVRVEVSPTETIAPKREGENAGWSSERLWRHRVPVRAANLSDVPLENALFRFRLAEVVRDAPRPGWALHFQGRRHAAERNGSDATFRISLAPRTIATLYAYVEANATDAPESAAAERAATGAVVPNDTGLNDEPAFPPGTVVRFAHVGDMETPPAESVSALAVEQADTASLVFPERRVDDGRGGFSLALARNEQEALQLAVRSAEDREDFECRASPPRNSEGLALNVESGWAECVFVDAPSTFYVHDTKPWMLMYPHTRHPKSDGWSGWWPDPIAPGGRTSLKAGATKAFRLLVKTTPETPPGEYSGSLVWLSGGVEVRRDTYTVHVWNFALPERRHFASTFDVRGLGTQKEREAVYETLKEYGLQADQTCRSLEFTRDAKGNVVCDFALFDRLTEDFFGKWGFTDSYFPRQPFYYFGWSRKPFDFLGEKAYEPGETDRSRLRPAYKAACQAALRLFWTHLKARGWERRFTLFVSDEPHLDKPEIVAQLKAICAMVHEVDPEIQTYSSTWTWHEDLAGSIDVWGISSGRFPEGVIPEMRTKGHRFWFTTDAQFPLDTPYLASELLYPMFAYFRGVEKMECWNCINFPKENTWKYGFQAFTPRFGIPGKKDRWVRVPCGDGVLMYPQRDGSTERYVPTLRINAVRDGMELHEYLALLEKVDTPAAAEILSGFRSLMKIPHPSGRYSKILLPDPAKIGRLREAAGTLLDNEASRK